MKTFNKKTTRIYLESGLLVGCATAMLYLFLSFVKWLLKEIEHQGFVATAAHLNRWVLDNPISIAWLCVALVLFNVIVMPYVLAALEDRDSFLSRLSVLVIGFLAVLGVASLVVQTINS